VGTTDHVRSEVFRPLGVQETKAHRYRLPPKSPRFRKSLQTLTRYHARSVDATRRIEGCETKTNPPCAKQQKKQNNRQAASSQKPLKHPNQPTMAKKNPQTLGRPSDRWNQKIGVRVDCRHHRHAKGRHRHCRKISSIVLVECFLQTPKPTTPKKAQGKESMSVFPTTPTCRRISAQFRPVLSNSE
jgi:hypothetical protein